MKVMINSEYLDKLKPIKEYEFISGDKLIILDERVSLGDAGFVGFGYIDDNAGTLYPTLFNYSLENGKVAIFRGVANGALIELVDGQLVYKDIATQQ